MFLISILIGVVLGFALKGNLKNLVHVKLNGLSLIFIGCGLEMIVKWLMKSEIMEIGMGTFVSDAIMYSFLIIFVFLNREDVYILVMGIGSLLNAIVIFANGGVMPVSQHAMDLIQKGVIPSEYGLYASTNDTSLLWFLGDIIYCKYTGPFIYSIGDVISVIAMITLIVSAMRGRYCKDIYINTKGRSSRKKRRERRQRLSEHTNLFHKEIVSIMDDK